MPSAPREYRISLSIGDSLVPGTKPMTLPSGTARPLYEDDLTTEIDSRIPPAMWFDWASMPTVIDPDTAAVRNIIVTALAHCNTATPGQTLSLTGGNLTAVEVCYRYIWRDGKLIRVHCYELNIMMEGERLPHPWLVSSDAVGVETIVTHLCAILTLEEVGRGTGGSNP